MILGSAVSTKHFYSRASARRDGNILKYAMRWKISTHAPLRGATNQADYCVKLIGISTHAPLRGATIA